MPVKMIKKKNGMYENKTPEGVKGKNMTHSNALGQLRLLEAIRHDPNFRPNGGRPAGKKAGKREGTTPY